MDLTNCKVKLFKHTLIISSVCEYDDECKQKNGMCIKYGLLNESSYIRKKCFYSNGKRDGCYEIFGAIHIYGFYEKGVKHGLWIREDKKMNTTVSCQYRHGKRHGTREKIYLADKKIKYTNYDRGERCGPTIIFKLADLTYTIINYDNGKPIDKTTAQVDRKIIQALHFV